MRSHWPCDPSDRGTALDTSRPTACTRCRELLEQRRAERHVAALPVSQHEMLLAAARLRPALVVGARPRHPTAARPSGARSDTRPPQRSRLDFIGRQVIARDVRRSTPPSRTYSRVRGDRIRAPERRRAGGRPTMRARPAARLQDFERVTAFPHMPIEAARSASRTSRPQLQIGPPAPARRLTHRVAGSVATKRGVRAEISARRQLVEPPPRGAAIRGRQQRLDVPLLRPAPRSRSHSMPAPLSAATGAPSRNRAAGRRPAGGRAGPSSQGPRD